MFGFHIFAHPSFKFHHSSLKYGGSHVWYAFLDLFSVSVFIAQNSQKWVMGEWEWKKKKKCFWVMEIEWWGYFCKYIHIVGPMFYVLSFLCHLTWLPNESMTFSSLIRYQIISFFFAFFFSLFLFSSQATLFSSYPSAINTTHYSLYPGLPLQLNSSLPSALSLSR